MRPPILYITVGFAVGLGLGEWGAAGAATWAVGLPVLAGAALVAKRAALGSALGVITVAGLLWGAAAVRERKADCVGAWGRGVWGVTRAAIVRLRDPVPQSGGVVNSDVVGGPCGGAVRIRWLEGVGAGASGYAARGGTLWVVAGRWLGSGERGVLAARRVRSLDGEPRGRGALRDRIARRAAALFGSRAPLVQALLISPNADLDAELRERYVRSGLAHILSISGLHVGFLAAWLAVALRLLGLSARTRVVAGNAIVTAYLWLLGFPAPATRAAVMLAVDGVARLRQRVVAPRGTLALAALVVLAVDPWALRSVGAWLSVAAMAAVVWAMRATERSPRWLRLVAPAAAATLLTAPITAWSFGTVAPIGVLANLVAIPLAGLAVPGLMLALATSWASSTLGALLAAGAGAGLALLDLVARGAAAVPGGHVVMAAGWRAAVLWVGVLAVAWWLWNAPRRRWVLAARLGFVAAVCAWTMLFHAAAAHACRCLTVHFLDVGQGDAAVLETPAGRFVLIDGGPRSPERDAGRRVVIPFLRRRGAARLALLVATHGDADHLGGLPAVLAALPAQLVLEPGEPLGRPLYLEFLAAVEGSAAAWHPARTGDRIALDGVTFEVLSPDSAWLAQPMDVNEHSVVLRVSFGNERLLFTGDAGLPVEARLAGRVGPVELLKVGHHGSRSATSEAWLDELRPREAVISVGAHNRYGHPAPEVLDRLARRGIAVFRTDRRGTITFRIDSTRAFADSGHHD